MLVIAADFDWVKKCNQVAAMTDGLSGRELSKLVVGWQVREKGGRRKG